MQCGNLWIARACMRAVLQWRYMKTKKPKLYVNIRIDMDTYNALRKIAFKKRMKLIDVLRGMFA